MFIHTKAFVGLVVITVVMFWPIFLGRFYVVGDIRDVFLPLEIFFQQKQRLGILPAWMGDASFGFPVIAAAQIGFFYPPLLIARSLPTTFYLPLLLIGHFLLLAAGTFYLARSLGRSTNAAWLASVSFAFGGFVMLHLTHLNIIFAAAYLPWQFLLARLFVQSKHFNYRHFCALLTVCILPWLVGQIQMPLLMLLVTSIWILYLGWAQPKPFWPLFGQVNLLWLAVFLLSAVQWLPTLELASQSRLAGVGFDLTRANQHSYPLYHLPTLFLPRFYDNDQSYWGKRLQIEYGFYAGTWPLILAAAAVIISVRRKLPRLASSEDLLPRFFIWMLTIAFLLSLGDLSPFRLIGLEPSLWFFSAPARWLLFASLSLSILASFGFDWLTGAHYPHLIRLTWRLFVFLAAAVILGNLFIWLWAPNWLAARSFSLPAATAGKLASLLNSARASSMSLASPYTYLPLVILLAGIIVPSAVRFKTVIYLSIAELIMLGITLTPHQPLKHAAAMPASLTELPMSIRNKQARILSLGDGGDTGAYFTNPASRADAAKREQQKQLLVPLTHTQYGIAGVEWPASLNLPEQEPKVNAVKDETSKTINLETAADLNIGATLGWDKNKTVITQITARPRAELTALNGTETQPIIYPALEDKSLPFHVAASQPSRLIVRDTFYQGWQARLDGKLIPIERYNNIFRSVSVPAGEHVVELLYRPKVLYIGLGISAATTIILSIGLIFARTRR